MHPKNANFVVFLSCRFWSRIVAILKCNRLFTLNSTVCVLHDNNDTVGIGGATSYAAYAEAYPHVK